MDSRSDFLKLPEKNGGNVILYVLVSFHTGDVFCTLSRLFVIVGHFVCFSARLAVHYFAVYSVLGSQYSLNLFLLFNKCKTKLGKKERNKLD